MTKSAMIDRRPAEYVVSSYTKAPSGVWLMNGRYSIFPLNAGGSVLGQAVLDALDDSNEVALPDIPVRDAKPFAPVLKELRFRSYGQYIVGTRSVGVRLQDDGSLRITPQRNNGSRGGFVSISDKVRVLDFDRNAETMSALVEAAMEDAEE